MNKNESLVLTNIGGSFLTPRTVERPAQALGRSLSRVVGDY